MEFLHNMLSVFTPYMERLNLYTMSFLGFILLVFIMLFVLGVLLWKRSAMGPLIVLIACLIPLTSPFSLEWVSKNVLFPIEVEVEGRTLSYSPTYFVSGSMTPMGKFPIKACLLTVTLNHQTNQLKQKIINIFKPMLVDKTPLEGPFVKGEKLLFQHAIDGIHEEVSSKIDISCF